MTESTFIPSLSTGTTQPQPPPRDIDPRLIQRGVTIETPPLQPGQTYWRIKSARWYNEQEAQGRHHIYVEAHGPMGDRQAAVPFLVTWPGGSATDATKTGSGFEAGNFPMSPSRNEFSIRINGLVPSETLKGIGMGADTPDGFNAGIHTSTGVLFEWATAPVDPPVPAPSPQGDKWARSLAFVRKWEGGFVNDPHDPGGATNKGITIDTYTRWRQAHGQPQPTVEELRNLSDEEANQIYFEWYWKASGADLMPWPLCLAQFDTAVNAGVGRAQEMFEQSNGSFIAYLARVIDWYTRIGNFERYGRAWIQRRAALLLEATK